MSSYSKFFNLLENREIENFLLIAHERPDGDTISAVLATKKLLEASEKKVIAVSSGGVPEVFRFLPNWRVIRDDFLLKDFQAIVLIDNGDLKRTGFLDRIMLAKKMKIPIVNIDHHPKNDIWKLASINIVDEKASSTCEIIYDIFNKRQVKIEADTATALLTGIYTDTGGFQHLNTVPKTLRIASDLLSLGGRLKKISDNISNYKSLETLKIWGIAFDRIKLIKKFGLVYSIITQKDIIESGASEDDLAGVVNILSTISGGQISLLLCELPDGRIKGSLRSDKSNVDVAKIAGFFGGGGHKKAAGFIINGKFEKVDGGWKIVDGN